MKAESTGTDLISKVLPGPAMARVKTERKIWMMNGTGRHLIFKIPSHQAENFFLDFNCGII